MGFTRLPTLAALGAQQADSDLAAIAALTTTAFGRAHLTEANAAAGATAIGVGAGDSPSWAGGAFAGSVTVGGNLNVTGAMVTAGIDNLEASYILQNDGYSDDAAVTSGIARIIDPTTTQTTGVLAGFVLGVAAVSDPKVSVTSSAGFVATDIVSIKGAGVNDGLYEVFTAAGNILTFRGTGLHANVEVFTRVNFTSAGTAVGATITKVNVAVDRTGTDGKLERAYGNQTPLTFSDYYYVGTTIPVVDGGTGATTKPGAQTNLGIRVPSFRCFPAPGGTSVFAFGLGAKTPGGTGSSTANTPASAPGASINFNAGSSTGNAWGISPSGQSDVHLGEYHDPDILWNSGPDITFARQVIGLNNATCSASDTPVNNSFYLRYSSAVGTNLYCCGKDSSTPFAVDLGVVYAANTWYKVRMKTAPGSVTITLYTWSAGVWTSVSLNQSVFTTNLPGDTVNLALDCMVTALSNAPRVMVFCEYDGYRATPSN